MPKNTPYILVNCEAMPLVTLLFPFLSMPPSYTFVLYPHYTPMNSCYTSSTPTLVMTLCLCYTQSVTGKKFWTKVTTNFKTSNIIYLIYCRKCSKQRGNRAPLHLRMAIQFFIQLAKKEWALTKQGNRRRLEKAEMQILSAADKRIGNTKSRNIKNREITIE